MKKNNNVFLNLTNRIMIEIVSKKEQATDASFAYKDIGLVKTQGIIIKNTVVCQLKSVSPFSSDLFYFH